MNPEITRQLATARIDHLRSEAADRRRAALVRGPRPGLPTGARRGPRDLLALLLRRRGAGTAPAEAAANAEWWGAPAAAPGRLPA